MTIAVHVENLGKRYKIGTAPQNRGGYNTLRDTISNTFSRQKRLKMQISSLPSEGFYAFVEETYGSLASDPIERGAQGEYEVREEII